MHVHEVHEIENGPFERGGTIRLIEREDTWEVERNDYPEPWSEWFSSEDHARQRIAQLVGGSV